MTRLDARRWLRRIWVTAGLGFTAWIVWNAQAHGVPAGTFQSSAGVRVDRTGERVRFDPVAAAPSTPGLVFLSGGAVDPDAYGPLLRGVADLGFPVALVPLPYRLAPTEGTRQTLWRRIDSVIDEWGPQRPVVVGGHSRGAALAGRFAVLRPDDIDGLLLVATTHPRDDDLSAMRVPIVKVLGTRDCVASPDAARQNGHRLPADARWFEIAGANHAQFAHYGTQLGDCRAEITRDAQQRQLRGAIVSLLDDVGRPGGGGRARRQR